jgi:hypothetical protein
MPPRRRGEPPLANRAVEREMRELRARMEAMEAAQRRAPDAGDISDAESEEVEVEEAAGENVAEERLLRAVVRLGARAKIEVPMYEGNLDAEELLDWIRSMDKYFDYEDVDEEKRVRHVVTRLKGHATLWWDELQAERRSKGKQKIKNWDRMVAKLKAKFMPKYYQINLFRKLQNLRQKGMTVKEYTEEFYKLNIRTGQREKDEEKVSRYINGLRYEIQDEINMMSVRTVEDAYQFALKAEEKLTRKQSQRGRGKSPVPNKGKGVAHDKAHKSKDETEKPHSHSERGGSSRGRQDGGRSSSRGRGRSRGEVRCYACGKTGHMSWECPEKKKEGGGEAHISEAQRRNVEAEGAEDGTSLMLRKVLLKPEAEVEKPVQRNSLFRTTCKTKDRVCKVIIDSGSTDNLVSTEMVEKLELETTAHPKPYKVSWLQKGHQVMVTKQCLVEFKIGGYRDEILCDVIPMDVCHILLGRPWQFDRNVIHDGRKNTYTLEKNGRTHMLLPIEEKKVKEEANTSILLMSGKELLKEVKKEQEMQFVVVRKPRVILTSTSMDDLPEEVQELLDNFADIVVDELPNSLPPIRSITIILI